MGDAITLELPDEAATLALGAALARALVPGLRLHLQGELGAGKTTLVRGLLQALGHQGRVRSPTYALCERYQVQPSVGSLEFERNAKIYFYHFDFYRLNSGDDWLEAGFREAFASDDAVCVVEWPEHAGATLPAPSLRIALAHREHGRHAVLEALDERGRRCLSAFAGRGR